MPIHFSRDRMMEVLNRHEQWWNGTLDRPLISGMVYDAYPPSPTAAVPLTQANCHDFSRSPEEIIDAADSILSRYEFILDGFPRLDLACFGPGILAAMLGARADNRSGSMWFFPCAEDITMLHVRYDPDHAWAKRIRSICRAGAEKWQGQVAVGMPDLGGVLDVLASLIGTENLLYATLDAPAEVRRLTGEIQNAWYAAYQDFAAALSPQGVYTDWNGILCSKPSYVIQCDFSYMLGPEMFGALVLPTLQADTIRLSRTIYHMDGIGQLPHLDMLLSLPRLDAVQWVYGTGKPGPLHWLDVYRRIHAAGKRIMVVDDPLQNGFREVCRAVGCHPFASVCVDKSNRQAATRLIS